MRALHEDHKRGKLIPNRGGYIGCPYCSNKKLLRVQDSTEAAGLPVYCRKCQREILIDIHRGQSYLSQSPSDP